jgi:nucleoside-diphosphate-sugar epimerase
MERVLVTGSAGEVGSVLLRQLAGRYDVLGFDRRPHEGAPAAIQGDLTDHDQVVGALEGVDAIAHLAAALPGRVERDPGDSVDANVKATATLLQAAVDAGVKRFVYCSTVWASGHGYTEPYLPIDEAVPCDPVCTYGQTKWLGELMTEWYGRRFGLGTVVLRFCGYNAVRGYREDGSIDWEQADLPAIFRRYLGDGYKLMNPIDLAEAFGRAIDNPSASGERFVIGCSTPYVAADAAALRSMPEAVVEKYYPGVPALLQELGIEVPPVLYYFSHEKARTRLGFRSQHDLGDAARLYREWRTKR